jgi:UDP-N-acetylglucosamine transferase subunit ALG13
MIFVTVGTQDPFDRLIKAVDEIAPMLGDEIVAQAFFGEYKPKNIKTIDFISPVEFSEYIDKAQLIIAHAGMGTIISATTKDKPIVVFPRKLSLGEHTTDHQMATAKKMKEMGIVQVAFEEDELKELLLNNKVRCLKHLGDRASDSLVNSIKEYINE